MKSAISVNTAMEAFAKWIVDNNFNVSNCQALNSAWHAFKEGADAEVVNVIKLYADRVGYVSFYNSIKTLFS